MLNYYITQGIKQRNQATLSQALLKAQQQPGLIAPDIMKQADVVLSELDAEHTAKYYLKNAVASKNIDAIQTAIGEANKLNLKSTNDTDIADATKVLNKLIEKQQRKIERERELGRSFKYLAALHTHTTDA
jgi:hypothetical protein